MQWYVRFRLEANLIRKLYTETVNQESNPIDLKAKAVWNKPLKFKLSDYVCGMFLSLCCCTQRCLRRRKRFKRYKQAMDKLRPEFDVLEIAQSIRLLNMLTDAVFAKRQAIFLRMADSFCVTDERKHSLIEPDYFDSFNPIDDPVDHKLANYLAGKQLSHLEL
jgi:hypothetical protein